MIAIPKPPNFAIIQRQHPVVVQPTRTPGLLSLSKPAQQRQQRPRPIQRPKQSPRPASPSRGRQQPKEKEKEKPRSASLSSVRVARRNHRQPSPPTFPSQAEAPSTPPSKVPHDEPALVRAAPKLAAHPSGKLARRRQPNNVPLELPTPSKAIPVPKHNHHRSSSVNFSKPDPFFSHVTPERKSKPKKLQEVFPICDDMTEVGELSDHDDFTPPSTPTPVRVRRYDDGPKTAPLSTSTISFPFATPPPSPLANKGARKHKRTPSEGVFTMSSDEERTPEPREYFGLMARPRASPSISREEELEKQAAALAAAYFASSNFQNSPSPEALPHPAF